jgi:hypothetical protein
MVSVELGRGRGSTHSTGRVGELGASAHPSTATQFLGIVTFKEHGEKAWSTLL